jgi:hypothetical protein
MNTWDEYEWLDDINGGYPQPFGWSPEVWPDELFWSNFSPLDLKGKLNYSVGIKTRISVDIYFSTN